MNIIKNFLSALSITLGVVMSAGCGQGEAIYEVQDASAAGISDESGEDSEEAGRESKDLSPDAGADTETPEDEKPPLLYVYVCGAIANPGVYDLPEGSRVYELIRAAGGLLEEADDRTLNQAEKLIDGMQITVYTKEEAADMPDPSSGTSPSGKSEAGSQKVNLNTADADRLTTLSGIGEARAKAIIAYREQNGGFQCIEDIMKIEGIKEKLFEKIKEQIEV